MKDSRIQGSVIHDQRLVISDYFLALARARRGLH
jgi:hypothetical protein